MDFDNAKENIQPLATGRNASILQASLRVESPQELMGQRKELEESIYNYKGEDPLEPWYTYVSWIEQSFPSGGKESGLEEVLSKCLSRFENEERYYQDRRMVKLYIKFIDSCKDPTECYQQLFNNGIGTMVADFYICWAYYYDLSGNIKKADEIFKRGLACRAKPLEELQEAHQHFGFSVAQRLMYEDDEDAKRNANRQLQERRIALTSLRGHKRKATVGSIRTGSVVKSFTPGTVQTDASASCSHFNEHMQILRDENENPNANFGLTVDNVATDGAVSSDAPISDGNATIKSVVRSIIDKAREQENIKEPGPWNKAHDKKKYGKLFSSTKRTNELSFNIHEDDVKTQNESYFGKALKTPIVVEGSKYDNTFKYPDNFVSKNKSQAEWVTPVTIENEPVSRAYPQYNKCMLYPRPNMEFQWEELRAYYFYKKCGVCNAFTKERDAVWSKYDINANVRQYPNFAKESKAQSPDALDAFYKPEKKDHIMVPFDEVYDDELKEEFQIEELMLRRLKKNYTINKSTDMEETMCTTNEKMQRRKSFFPLRKSLAPKVTVAHCSEFLEDKVIESIPEEVNKQILKRDTYKSEDSLQLPSTSKTAMTMSPTEVKAPTKSIGESKSAKISQQQNDFEIYEDSKRFSHEPENNFQFKAPAMPATMRAANLPFEIYTETSPTDIGGSGGFLDAEETCSTQTFNIFLLKSQSMSTPKVPQKVAPRQFGNILKDIPLMQIDEETSPSSAIPAATNTSEGDVGAAAVNSIIASDSPPRNKQLSTILETSEHVSTQGTTHTTGASTKSTISSQENDEANIVGVTSTATARLTMPQTGLETLQEHSRETSTISSPKVEELIKSMNLYNNRAHATSDGESSLHAKSQIDQEHLPVTATPAGVRLQAAINTEIGDGASNFSIFTDPTETQAPKHQVCNFTRLEECEDTATAYSVRSVRFQEDKTETISKMLIASRQEIKFREENTENVSKIAIPVIFEDDRATESIAKLKFQPPNLMPTASDPLNVEDSFQFFTKTPPKNDKALLGIKKLEQQEHTPLQSFSKRFCDKDTPKISLTKSSTTHKSRAITTLPSFECELETPNLMSKSNTKLLNSFPPSLGDVSIIPSSQPIQSNASAVPSTIKHKGNFSFGDSFIPDFSLVEEAQLQDPSPAVSNLSFIPESQPNSSCIATNRISEQLNDKKLADNVCVGNQKSCDSFLPEISMVLESQQMSSAIKWKTKNKSGTMTDETQKHNLLESFVKDFSVTNAAPKELINDLTSHHPTKANLTLINNKTGISPTKEKHSFSSKVEEPISSVNFLTKVSSAGIHQTTQHKLSFLNTTKDVVPVPATEIKPTNNQSVNEQFFELNCETEMFSTNISKIKNSTFLPTKQKQLQHVPNFQQTQIQEKSLHIKEEISSPLMHLSAGIFNRSKLHTRKESFVVDEPLRNKSDMEFEQQKNACVTNIKSQIHFRKHETFQNEMNKPTAIEDGDYGEMSIYFKHTPKSPKIQLHTWEDDSLRTPTDLKYRHAIVDLNQTNQVIEDICMDPNVNPFNGDLISAFLDHIDFSNYISELPTCMLVGHVSRLQTNTVIKVHNTRFDISKLIGEGAYGAVYCGVELSSGKKYALKQERPPNYWEYYICLEVHSRLKAEEMFPAFMNVDYALIGHNSSILISEFSQYGSLITVCNRIKRQTTKNVDEYIVMLLTCELLEIIDHLHAANIIHADIKPDNFILMNNLRYPSSERALQLIDFGVSIDMKLFKPGQEFSYINQDNSFKCIEMRENRTWTYQLDLFGLASVIHVLLFGKYMEVEQRPNGTWMHKTHMPRYFHKMLWENIFKSLLNIRDSNSMPNLQMLRAQIKEELAENEKSLLGKIAEFNMALRI